MTRGTALRLGLLAAIWGSSFLLIAVAVEELTPLGVTFVRLTSAATVLLLVLASRRMPLPRGWSTWGHLILMGAVANAVPFTAFAFGQERITSGLAGVLNGATPLFTVLAASFLLADERLTRIRGIGVAIGFVGVVVVIGPWDTNPLTSSPTGQLACLGAAACYGLAFAWTRRHLTGEGWSVLQLATGQLLAAAGIMLLTAPWVLGGVTQGGARSLTAAIVLGAFHTGLAYLLYYRLVSEDGATTASMVTYLIPVVAVALGAAVRGEPVGVNLFIGAAVVLMGVAIADGRLRLPGGTAVDGTPLNPGDVGGCPPPPDEDATMHTSGQRGITGQG